MGRKTITGLYERNRIWIINKLVTGYGRIYESTGTSDRAEAEQILIHKLEKIRQFLKFGEKEIRKYIFREAATRYLQDYRNQPSIELTAMFFKQLDPFIGHLEINDVDDTTLKPYVTQRLGQSVSPRTINMALQRVSRVLRLCATKWRDEDKQLWLARPPLIEMLEDDPREPYPLSFVEQRIFFQQLAPHLAPMALFKVNTGTRDQEVCKLRWDWEINVPELNTSVFLIPKKFGGRRPNSGVKNRTERLVILNRVAKSVVDEQRGIHPLYVFPHKGKYLQRMNENGWKQARKRAALAYEAEMGEEPHPGFKNIRVHDLKHTYGRRLRAAGVAFEDRQVLLGHKSRNVTEHYSSAEIGHLLEQAEKILTLESSSPTLTVIRRRHS